MKRKDTTITEIDKIIKAIGNDHSKLLTATSYFMSTGYIELGSINKDIMEILEQLSNSKESGEKDFPVDTRYLSLKGYNEDSPKILFALNKLFEIITSIATKINSTKWFYYFIPSFLHLTSKMGLAKKISQYIFQKFSVNEPYIPIFIHNDVLYKKMLSIHDQLQQLTGQLKKTKDILPLDMRATQEALKKDLNKKIISVAAKTLKSEKIIDEVKENIAEFGKLESHIKNVLGAFAESVKTSCDDYLKFNKMTKVCDSRNGLNKLRFLTNIYLKRFHELEYWRKLQAKTELKMKTIFTHTKTIKVANLSDDIVEFSYKIGEKTISDSYSKKILLRHSNDLIEGYQCEIANLNGETFSKSSEIETELANNYITLINIANELLLTNTVNRKVINYVLELLSKNPFIQLNQTLTKHGTSLPKYYGKAPVKLILKDLQLCKVLLRLSTNEITDAYQECTKSTGPRIPDRAFITEATNAVLDDKLYTSLDELLQNNREEESEGEEENINTTKYSPQFHFSTSSGTSSTEEEVNQVGTSSSDSEDLTNEEEPNPSSVTIINP